MTCARSSLFHAVSHPHPAPRTRLDPTHTVSPLAGVYGTISRFVVTIPSSTATYHFYELDVLGLHEQWPEAHERRREWVDFAEAYRRCAWKPELAQALLMASIAPR